MKITPKLIEGIATFTDSSTQKIQSRKFYGEVTKSYLKSLIPMIERNKSINKEIKYINFLIDKKYFIKISK